jgi:hypothetical protein
METGLKKYLPLPENVFSPDVKEWKSMQIYFYETS